MESHDYLGHGKKSMLSSYTGFLLNFSNNLIKSKTSPVKHFLTSYDPEKMINIKYQKNLAGVGCVGGGGLKKTTFER